jgi:MYXO-CTERM domain-containing protein
MTRSTTTFSISILAALSLAAPAMADDLFPAPWRLTPGTTVQHWDFTAGPGGGAPDALPLNNPFGSPMMAPASGSVWMPTFNGRNDVWNLSGAGALTFDIPNTGNIAHQKEVWLQVTYFSPAPSPGPGYTVAAPTTGPFTQISSQLTPLPGGWVHELTRWVTPVCPQLERISIFPSLVGTVVFIDQVVIDTQCAVPAPGAAATLALGGLVALRRRR